MKKFAVLCTFIPLLSLSAHASKSCTTEPKDKWMKIEDFKKMVEAEGYKIFKFKTSGTCYEIYGTNKEGKKVEIYFNPVNGSIAQEG